MDKEIGLILPTYGKRNKRFIGKLIGNLASGVIGLAFEGKSSFLHHKGHKSLTKAVNIMKEMVNLQHNGVYHLEDTMIIPKSLLLCINTAATKFFVVKILLFKCYFFIIIHCIYIYCVYIYLLHLREYILSHISSFKCSFKDFLVCGEC